MRAVRGLVVLVAAAVVAGAYVATRHHHDATAPAATHAATNAVHVPFAYSSNLEDLMQELIPRFNSARVEVHGRPVFVDGESTSSGDAENGIAKGAMRPVAWSPASSLWGRLLDYEADRAYVANENPSLARSPVVIAMWEPLARALGWPRKRIGFADILALATTKSDWASYGKPTFGRFKLGHTNPDFSTSGLSFVAAQYYNASGKIEGLTLADVQRPAIRAKVRAIEQTIVHYGDTGSFFADQLAAHGPGYASAVAMEETTLLEFNQARKQGDMRLVGIYPADGTFVTDNPFIVLHAPWVTPEQRAAATRFGAWLRKALTPKLVARYGYRPGDAGLRAAAPVTRANGADPAQPTRLLSLPQPRVLAAIRKAWRVDRKAANILLVVDVSGSMEENGKIAQAREGVRTFLRQLSPRDRVGLLAFSDDIRLLAPVRPFATQRARLDQLARELFAGGGTALNDAVGDGWRRVDALHDDSRINAVVVLSDGQDTASDHELDDVLGPIRARSRDEGRQIRIFTIAYGSDADKDTLERVADASGGKAYVGDPATIRSVYLQISSFF